MGAAIETDVVIVGAGPTGLSLTCQLVRHGVRFVVVKRNEGVMPYSKAIGVHARTLEIYEQFGLSREALEEGTVAGKVRALAGGEVRGEFDLSEIGEGLSPHQLLKKPFRRGNIAFRAEHEFDSRSLLVHGAIQVLHSTQCLQHNRRSF